jgi:FkbM family methyltransferase
MFRALTVWAARRTPDSVRQWIHSSRFLERLARRTFAGAMRLDGQNATIPAGPMAGIRVAVGEHVSHAHLNGTYERETLEAVDALIQPGFICYDLGASIGYISLLMARKAKHVYAFEPAPHAAAEIRRQMAANGFENFTIITDPVSDSRRQVEFALTDVAYGSRIRQDPQSQWPTLKLTCTTLDEFIAGHPFPDFVKIDVEDEEGRVIAGAPKLLAERRTAFCCELHSQSSAEQVTAAFARHRYRVTTLAGEPFRLERPIISGEVQVIAAPLP